MRQHYNPRTDPRRPTETWEVVVCLAAFIAIGVMLGLAL